MSIYNNPNGVAPHSALSRGCGNYSRQAPLPPFCHRVDRALLPFNSYPAALAELAKAFFDANPSRRVCYVCDKPAVDAWLAAHPKSKMHTQKTRHA